jgi:hypothetical protein
MASLDLDRRMRACMMRADRRVNEREAMREDASPDSPRYDGDQLKKGNPNN